MEKDLVVLLKNLMKKMENVSSKNGKKIRYVKELNELISMFSGFKIPDEFKEKYSELLVKGTELNEGENYRNIKMIEKFLPRCFYFYYEVRGEANHIMRKLSYAFVITCILFLPVAFPIFPPLLTIVFILPMFIGIRGLRKGLLRGLTIGMTLIEFSLLTGLIGLYLIFQGLSNYHKFLEGLVEIYNKNGLSLTTSNMNLFVIIYVLFVVALIGTSIYTIIFSRKYKRIFL